MECVGYWLRCVVHNFEAHFFEFVVIFQYDFNVIKVYKTKIPLYHTHARHYFTPRPLALLCRPTAISKPAILFSPISNVISHTRLATLFLATSFPRHRHAILSITPISPSPHHPQALNLANNTTPFLLFPPNRRIIKSMSATIMQFIRKRSLHQLLTTLITKT